MILLTASSYYCVGFSGRVKGERVKGEGVKGRKGEEVKSEGVKGRKGEGGYGFNLGDF